MKTFFSVITNVLAVARRGGLQRPYDATHDSLELGVGARRIGRETWPVQVIHDQALRRLYPRDLASVQLLLWQDL